jgi:hypothetical protein
VWHSDLSISCEDVVKIRNSFDEIHANESHPMGYTIAVYARTLMRIHEARVALGELTITSKPAQ